MAPHYDLDLEVSHIPAQGDDVILETTVCSVLRQAASRHGDQDALVEVGPDGSRARCWTYRELLRDSTRLAEALASRYVPGERVVVWAPNIPEWVMMEYACGLAGLVLVTANPSYQSAELRFVLEQSQASGLFMIREHRGNPMQSIATEACRGLTRIREIVDLEDTDVLYRRSGPALLPEVAPSDAAQIQYTSGTTGFPKGAVLSHRSMTNNARFFTVRAGTRSDSVWANFMPMFHTSGCGLITLGAVQAGCAIHLVRAFDPLLILQLIERERVTALLGVPTMLIAMIECLQQQTFDVGSIEVAVSGGSMVAPELVRSTMQAFGCSFQTVYGQTEASPLVTQHCATDSIDDICNNVGQPIPQTELSIRDVRTSQVLPIDTDGEVCVRGYCRMIGYFDNPDATAAAMDADGWLHTGDLGAIDRRGFLRITGRVKEMIIRGGENLFPAEIENALLEHHAVAEVAVAGLPDPRWGEIVAAFVRPEPGHSVDPEDLRRHCRNRLSPQKTPVVWEQVDRFPLTGSGKIRKFALVEEYLSVQDRDRS